MRGGYDAVRRYAGGWAEANASASGLTLAGAGSASTQSSHFQLMDRAFNERARRDLQRGVDQGRFTLENVDIAARLIMATLLTLMHAILEDRAEPRLIIESVALQLRMLGVRVKEARRRTSHS